MLKKGSTARKDLIGLAAAAAVAFVVAVYFDVFESFERWARSYERWQVDELVVVPLVLAFAFGLYSWRRRSELGESEERFRLLAENAQDVIFSYRLKPMPRFEYVSPSVTAMIGYTPEEHYADPAIIDKVVHPEDRRIIEQTLRCPEERITLRWLRKDGGIVWTEQRNKPIYDAAGTLAAVEGIVRDITERKRAEEKLRESEEKFRSIVETTDQWIWNIDLQALITYSNPAVEKVLGYPLEEIVGKDSLMLMHGEDRKKVEELLPRLIADKSGWNGLVLRWRCKDGTYRWLESAAVPILDDDGEVVGYRGADRDVTERKRSAEALKDSEERFRSLVQNASDVIVIMGSDQTVRYVSPAVQSVLGYKPEDVIGNNNLTPVHPDDLARVQRTVTDAVSNPGTPSYMELRLGHTDGSWRHVETVCTSLLDDLAVDGIVFNSRDITKRKRAEEGLRKSEARNRSILEAIPDLIFLTNQEGEFLDFQANTATDLYVPRDEIIGKNLREVMPPEFAEPALRHIVKTLDTDEMQVFEYQLLAAEGVRDYEARMVVNAPTEVLSVVRDVTESKSLQRSLEHRAFHDDLTGLPNRALFAERLERALAGSDGQGGRVAVLFVDIDNFKNVNDSLGHWAGDRLLAQFAWWLEATVRPEDTVARFGGDEFAILLADVTEREAVEVAERTIEELRREHFVVAGHELLATPSIGIAISGCTERGWGDLLRRADLALHLAKDRGKARHRCFTPDLDDRLWGRLKLEGELRGALQRGEFRVFYQPKVSISSGEIVGMEALVRWEHPERGLLAPSEFLALAEETGLIVPIGEWVLEEACRQAKEWQGRSPHHPPIAMSVNLSAKQFRRPDLAEHVGAVLGGCALDPRGLTLEITESTAMEDVSASAEALGKLKAMGVRIEVDDFGTGYSSLSYLKRFPVDYLKVDRSFVAGLGHNPEDEGIVRAVVELAHTLGLEAVAEGVESGEQLGLLREMGCELAQGFYFWAALSAEEVWELLAAYSA